MLAFSIAPASHAEDAPRSYAVMSLVGNTLSVHAVRPDVGIRTEGDSRTVLPITDPVFDAATLRAADAVIRKAQPSAKVVLLMTQDAGLYQSQNAMFEAAHANQDNRAYLLSLLKDRGVSHLLLITRERDNARFEMTNGFVGKGSLEGVGFYIDDTLHFTNVGSSESSTGMLGPFAYVRVRLLDAATLALLRETKSTKSFIIVRPSASPNAMEMWTSMASPAKIKHIEDLLGYAMQDAIPKVLAP